MDEQNKNQSNLSDPKENLEDLLRNVKKKGHDIAEHTRKGTEYGLAVSDDAELTLNVIKHLPPNTDFETLIDRYEAVDEQAEYVLAGLNRVEYGPMLSTVSSSDTAGSKIFDMSLMPTIPESNREEAEVDILALQEHYSRPANKEEVKRLMIGLGLDKPNPKAKDPKLSPLELFISAHDAFNRAPSKNISAGTTLLNIRQAIDDSIEMLFLQRPQRRNISRAKGTPSLWAKVYDIGMQLRYSSISESGVQNWASDCYDIREHDLHPSKSGDLDREEQRKCLVRATHFLISFLGGLDPNKLNRI